MVNFPFEYPPLLTKEIRENVLYTGLCHSDIFKVTGGWESFIYYCSKDMK